MYKTNMIPLWYYCPPISQLHLKEFTLKKNALVLLKTVGDFIVCICCSTFFRVTLFKLGYA